MDTCYMLSFAPTMLNTSLYNLNVWNKWDLEHFWPRIGISMRAGPAEDLLRNMSPSRFLRIMGMI